MKYKKVIGRQRYGACVLFRLENGMVAVVTRDGYVSYSPDWARMLRFTQIDARGSDCVPADELREAIKALERETEESEEYVSAMSNRMPEDLLEEMRKVENEEEAWCRNATDENGNIVWDGPYD